MPYQKEYDLGPKRIHVYVISCKLSMKNLCLVGTRETAPKASRSARISKPRCLQTGYHKDTINCPEKVMKISHFNQRSLSIL